MPGGGGGGGGGSSSSGDALMNYEKKLEKAVGVHQKALEDLVSVNSLFTAAIFVGLAFASARQQNIEGNKLCEAGLHVARRLVKNEVISFACYLLGTLFTLSALTSIIGAAFLTYSMVDMIQLLLGKIACKDTETIHAVGALMAVNGLALVIYVPFVLHAIFNSTNIFDNLNE
ncbi:hypothetical protein ACJRO7_000026 [Eucalyptus globulus]|uniref:Maternal effect embryo arrest protein n=1 Tax=Eucalyptus globulus TaxID=34317 RepID=A0ABD3LL65_EUCGL